MNHSSIFLILLVTAISVGFLEAELFTSNAHLQTALYAERDIAGILRNYLDQEEARLKEIRRLADDYDSHSTQALENIDRYLANPINAFLLIKRFTLDWDRDVLTVISNNTWDDMYKQVEQVRSDLPTFEDLKGAASALMRLQDTYQLDTSSVAHGNLRGVKSPVLSAEECFELGRLSYNNGDFYHTTLWMEQALVEHDVGPSGDLSTSSEAKESTEDLLEENITSGLSDEDSEKAELFDFLAFSYYKLGNVPQALELTNELLKINPNHERAGNNKKYFEAMVRDEAKKPASEKKKKPGYQANRDEYRNSDEFLTYEALCRGETTQPLKDAHKLTCQFVNNGHPLLVLQPMKEETVHLDPWVVIYHDVMNDHEMNTIKHLATPRLNRATVQNVKTGELETAHYRISKSAWLRGEEHPVVQRVNDRISAVTGLDLTTAEELQVANYGLGGHYEPHYDFARKEEKDAFKSLGTGNRIATFLTYMTDVEAGGATVFPYIGLKLFPKKGAAAFWYNLYRNGDGIYTTRHAACPVLVGTKWVTNKWIHERGQEFRRPCGILEDD